MADTQTAPLSEYQQRCLRQAEAWYEGFPMHNAVDNECCPDFSCCMSNMFIRDKEKRKDMFLEIQTRYGVIQ